MHEQSSWSTCIEDILSKFTRMNSSNDISGVKDDPIVSKASFLSHTNCLIHAR